MLGQRVEPETYPLKPGDYVRRAEGWYGMSPNGLLANLNAHKVSEHRDGSISVEPSILVKDGQGSQWHGYLTAGVWTEC